MESEPKSLFLFSDAIALAIMSCVAYALTFLYELGWLSYYQLPASLIQLDLTSIFVVFAAMGAIVGFAFFAFMVVPIGVRHYLGSFGVLLTIVGCVAGVVIGLRRTPRPYGAIVGIAAFGFLLSTLVFKMIRANRAAGKKWWEWMKSTAAPRYLPTSPDEHTFYTSFLQHLANRGVNIFFVSFGVVVVLYGLEIAYNTGYQQAGTPSRFLTSTEDSSTILLRVIGNRAILGRISRSGDTLFNDYSIVSADDLSRYHWFVQRNRIVARRMSP